MTVSILRPSIKYVETRFDIHELSKVTTSVFSVLISGRGTFESPSQHCDAGIMRENQGSREVLRQCVDIFVEYLLDISLVAVVRDPTKGMKVILRRANVVSQSNKSAQPTTSKSIIGCAYGGAQLSVLGVVDLRIGLTRSYMIGDDIHHEVHAGAV